MVIVKEAQTAYRLLNGVFCIYKSCRTPHYMLQSDIRRSICLDLNSLETRPCNELVQIVGNVGVDNKFEVHRTLSLADHPLVVGDRYKKNDLSLRIYQNLGLYVSGVTLAGIGPKGLFTLSNLKKRNLVKEYEITCRLGMATDDFTEHGKVIRKANLKFASQHKINILCNRLLSTNTRYALRHLGIKMRTEEAYDFLSKGPIKAEFMQSDAIIYSLKCVKYDPPYCILQMTCVNENPLYISHLVNNLGLRLKTYACVNKMSVIRIGKFVVEDSLSYKEITAENVINNIEMNRVKVHETLREKSLFNHQYQNIKFNNRLALQEHTNPNLETPLITSETN